ncbi:manganese efflux pump MntP [Stanieria sp. NIES-3757]|nr:manganese efflux pump MntP [Stanieria sp. NIES-3757]
MIIGCLTLIKFFQPNGDRKTQANNFLQSEANKDVSLKEAAVIGMALTITNLGTGISAGIAQLDLFFTSLFSSATSIILISLGNLFGDLINSILSRRKLEFISGFLLICLGLFELVA